MTNALTVKIRKQINPSINYKTWIRIKKVEKLKAEIHVALLHRVPLTSFNKQKIEHSRRHVCLVMDFYQLVYQWKKLRSLKQDFSQRHLTSCILACVVYCQLKSASISRYYPSDKGRKFN